MRLLISVIAICFYLCGFAQSEWKEVFRIQEVSDNIVVDVLNNIYSIDKAELDKYDSDGIFQFRFSDKQLGNIGSVDATYPLRPFVLYSELNYVVMLDNTLSNNRGNINLLNHNIGLATAACSSVQNHFWFYDAMSFSLIRTDENFKPVSNSGNLSQILNIDLQPNFMVEFANRVYMNNPETGILVFDNFGTYIKTIPLTGLSDFQVFENEIIYFENGNLIRYNTLLYESMTIEIPIECEDAFYAKNRLTLRNKDEIIVLEKTP